MANTDLQTWLKDTTSWPGGEIPQDLLPVLQSLRDRLSQSERKIQALLRQKQLFTLLVNGTVDMFIMFSAQDLRVEYVSPNVEFILGLPLDEVKADIRRFFDTAPEMAAPTREELMQIPIGGCIQFLDQHTHLKNGEQHWYRKSIYHFYLNNDHKFIMVMSDRTVEMDMQKQLEISIEMTKSANEAKSSFLANMSHDIRTPMNAIVGFSRLLKHDAENPDKVREHARKISSSSQHLLNLINDILDVSKIESGKATLRMDEFDLSELLEDIGIVVAPQAKAKNQTFQIRTQGVTADRLKGDKTRINQILLNLLSNSVKYTQDGGNIQLLISQQGDSGRYANLCFRVKDNGMGMSPSYLEVIFDSFTREETAATRGIQGTGLGMAITKNLVELMGGSISVESEQGKGSEFTVHLKLPSLDLDTDRSFWKENEIRKILVADEDEAICADIKAVMAATGVVVAHTCSGEQAIQFITGAARVQQQYDLVLMGRELGGMSGVEITRHLQETLADQAPPILLFDYGWSDIEDDALTAGMAGFLPRPFLLSSLRGAIRQLNNQASEEAEESQLSIADLRFLAAEDNELNAEILRELLDLEGAACQIAENGQAALEMFTNAPAGTFDLILMDVQMPVMDGYAAARAIRDSSHPEAKTIPITAMTANVFDEDVQHALAAGMNAHIAKPVDMAQLKETVTELLNPTEEA